MAGPRDPQTEAFIQYLLTDNNAPADVSIDNLFDPTKRAEFLRNEKDTRPYDDTWQRHTFFPIGVNGYNNTPPGRSYGPAQPNRDTFPSLSMPGMVHDTVEGFKHFGDMVRGNQPVSYLDETGRERPTPEAMGSVNALVGATMVGGGAATKPKGSAGSFAGREATLPMDEASRLARANKMGFNTDQVWYRGAHKNQEIGHNSYWTPDKAYAQAIADMNGGDGQLLSAYMRTQKPLYTDDRMLIETLGRKDNLSAIDGMKANGYDSAILSGSKNGVEDLKQGGGLFSPQKVVFDPVNIRSTDAAFDPTKSHLPGLLFSNSSREGGAAGIAANTGRTLDPLGYYSKLDEVLGAFRPTDTVTSQTLAQRGVKASELQARGLDGLLERGGAKVQDLIAKASEPVRLNENVYGTADKAMLDKYSQHAHGMPYDQLDARTQRFVKDEVGDRFNKSSKWSTYSLDKGSNPTYRESVLHLPNNTQPVKNADGTWTMASGSSRDSASFPTRGEALAAEDEGRTYIKGRAPNFRSGHWDDPNVIAHMRTSMQKDSAGRPVFHIDELQSDWGQMVRDGGVRDEAKIADLVARDKAMQPALDEARANLSALEKQYGYGHPETRAAQAHLQQTVDAKRLIMAEKHTAQASSPGHPLVNTSDQWQTTALRRALRQATEANADAVAIPSGNTVHRYDMGTEGGAASQEGVKYAYDKMYPNVLAKELAKLDPTIKRQLETLLGHEDKGPFSYFPLTDTAKQKIREGLPLFSNADTKAGSAGVLSIQDKIKNLEALDGHIYGLPRDVRRPLDEALDIVSSPSNKYVNYDVVPKGKDLYGPTGDSQSVGTFVVKPSQRLDKQGVESTNSRLAEDYQRQGIGTKVYDTIGEDFANFGGVNPSPRNQLSPAAIEFWRKRLGHDAFSNASSPTGSIASLPQSDRDALRRIMERFGMQ